MIFGKVERLLIAGLLCLSFWLFSLRIPGNRVLQYMERFVMHDDGRYLLTAAAVLVAINTFRAILLYLGWFYLGESLAFSVRGKAKAWLLPLIAIQGQLCRGLLLSGVCLSSLWNSRPFQHDHRLYPACFHSGHSRLECAFHGALPPCFSFQCLDLAPVLTRWGFGHGELSMTIKEFALLQDWGWVLDALAFGFLVRRLRGELVPLLF
jgi:hypothetical protein